MTDIRSIYIGDQRQAKVYLGSELIIGAEYAAPSLDLTPPEDTPLIVASQLANFEAPRIPGSVGWWRERRQGYAETPPGDWQSAQTDLDVGGSSYFAYPGLPGAKGEWTTGQPDVGYVVAYEKPDSLLRYWPFNVRFVTSSPTVEFRFRTFTTNLALGVLMVNGRRVQERSIRAIVDGNGWVSMRLSFPSAKPRSITLYGANERTNHGGFSGVAVEPGYTVDRPQFKGRTVAVIGDSYAQPGNSVVWDSETFPWRFGWLLGADTIMQAGVRVTGFVKGAAFMGRIPPVAAAVPDVLLLAGGRFDEWDDEYRAAVEATIAAARQTGAEVVVASTASEAAQPEVRAAIKDACASQFVRFLDVAFDAVPHDGIVPTWEGQQMLADQLFAAYSEAPAPFDPTVLPVYDEFSDVADGQVPTVAESGQTWGIFSGPSSVTDGYWDSDDNTAAYLECDSGLQPVTQIGARFRFNDIGGTRTTSGTLALVTWADGGIVANGFGRRTSCHVTITQTFVQWYVRDTVNGGNVTLLYTQPLSKLPANVDLTAEVFIAEGTGTVTVGGQTLTWEDPRISPVEGERFVCWEPFYGGGETDTRAQVAEVWADGTPPEPVEVGLTGAAYTRSEASLFSNTVTVPATVQEGDLLLLVGQFISGAATPLSAPTGWSEIGQHTRSAISAACWWKIADAGDIGQPVAVTSPVDRVHTLAVYGIAGVQSVTLGGSNDQASGSANFTVPSYTATAGAIPAHVLCVVSSANPDPVAFTAPSGMTAVSDNMPGSGARQGILLGVADGWEPDATNPVTTWEDTFDTDISGWSGYISTPAGTWAAPGALRMGSSGDVINWAVTNGDYQPGGKFSVTARMRVVENLAGDVIGPHVSFNFGGTQVTAHVTGWDHPVGEWGDFTTTGTVPASFNPETQTGNLRLGMRFAGSGQSVVEVDSVTVQSPGIGTTWVADDTTHFGIKWALELIPT